LHSFLCFGLLHQSSIVRQLVNDSWSTTDPKLQSQMSGTQHTS
jgi:hypothetical protein